MPKSNPVPPGKNEEVATISLNELATAKPVGFKATKKKLTNKKNSNTSTAKKTIPKNQDKPSAPIAATTKEIELEEGNEIDFN